MSKPKKVNTKKIATEINKAYKKNPKRAILLTLILLLLVAVGLYLYSEGYFDIPENEPDPAPIVSSGEQDENGFYYYSLTDYEAGDYYYSAKNLIGENLANQLHIIINDGFNKVSYGDARYVLAYSDRDPENNNESVRGIYDSDVIATYWIGSGAGKWEREHVWPNSKLGVASVNNNTKNQASDLHNLRAITGINQTRSNRYFAAGSGSATTVGTNGFYPGDDHKGDVARILFYMEIMYDVLTLTNDIDLLEDQTNNYKPAGAYAGILDLLIQWHKEDPVDEFERQRNEFIYSGEATNPDGKKITPQGNRNPFIDKPEYVHLIWEGKTIKDLEKPRSSTTQLSIRIIFCVKPSRENEWLV